MATIAQRRMRVTRLYTGVDQQSHFEDYEVDMDDHGLIGYLSQRHPVKSLIFRYTEADYDYTWHNAPERQYIVILEGGLDVEIGDGTRRQFGPGDIVLAEDLTGQGHISRAVNAQPRRSLFITLD
jgi:hypothetical protein